MTDFPDQMTLAGGHVATHADVDTIWGHEMQDILHRVAAGTLDPTVAYEQASHLFHLARTHTRTLIHAEYSKESQE